MGEKNKPRFGAANQWVPRIAIVLLLLVGSAGGYMWYWTKAPLPVEAQAAEAALADGHLVAIAHINVAKFIQLNRFMFGELDPEMLPMQTEDKDLINALFNGPANLREKSDQLLFAVHVPVPSRAVRTLLLSGRFDKDAVLRTLESYYLLKDSEGESWYVMQEKPTQTDATCPSKTPGTLSKQSWYLFLGPKLAMIVDDRNYGAQLLDRFEAGAPAAQDIGRWEQYRADQLASLMVMSIPGASKALSGMSGMAAQQAATEHQEVTGVAASLGLDLLARGLNANLSLISNDTTWKRNTTDEIRQQLLELKDDTRRVTPTLAKLLSQIQVSDRTEALEIDVVLDGSILENLSQVMQESFSSMFQVGISVGQQDGPLEEQLQREPKNYAANAAFASLPELELAPHDTKPLFKQDAFTIDLGSIRINESALVELQLQSKVALPKGESQFGGERTGEFSLAVDSVEDTMGNDLRRDERCVEPNEIFHRSPNHQPETTTSIFQEHAQITKHVRLREGVSVEDIHRIRGRVSFSAPVAVRKFSVALQAGEHIEHAGVRFYLSRVGDSSVSYQVSGDRERLLEVRALNRDGKSLRTGWRVSGGKDGRATQQYQGEIHALEVFVAERFAEHSLEYQLVDLFAPPEKLQHPRPNAFAPKRIDPNKWAAYGKLDMRKLEIDSKAWHVYEKNTSPIAAKHWAGVSMYLTHTPKQWGNSPQAHIYFPMLPELPAALSAFSYQIEAPAVEEGPISHYAMVSYPYRMPGGELVVRHRLAGAPIALGNWALNTGLKENERLEQLKGKFVFRLPIATESTKLKLGELWQGKTVEGVTVTLTEVGRGMFPGYALKVEGDIARLVNLHGIDAEGRRVMADPINYQQGGYWTMTVPFGKGIETVELVLAKQQEIMEYPFSLRPRYSAQ